jgi:hypothetical protein
MDGEDAGPPAKGNSGATARQGIRMKVHRHNCETRVTHASLVKSWRTRRKHCPKQDKRSGSSRSTDKRRESKLTWHEGAHLVVPERIAHGSIDRVCT